MAFHIIPLFRSPLGYFDRQRYLFPSWRDQFEDDWPTMDLMNAMLRYDRQLEGVREDLHQLDDKRAPVSQSRLLVQNPFVTDAEGNRKFSLRFDVSKFNPDEVTVKTVDNNLIVHAKHIEEGRVKIHREFRKEYILPGTVDPKSLKSTLSKDGVLQIEAPAPLAVKAPKENLVPIERLDEEMKPDGRGFKLLESSSEHEDPPNVAEKAERKRAKKEGQVIVFEENKS